MGIPYVLRYKVLSPHCFCKSCTVWAPVRPARSPLATLFACSARLSLCTRWSLGAHTVAMRTPYPSMVSPRVQRLMAWRGVCRRYSRGSPTPSAASTPGEGQRSPRPLCRRGGFVLLQVQAASSDEAGPSGSGDCQVGLCAARASVIIYKWHAGNV